MASIAIERTSRRDRDVAERAMRLALAIGPVALVAIAQLVVFGMPLGYWVSALVLGLLGSLMAVALGLVYRLNKILNFAQADLGTAPALLAFGLVGLSGVNYVLGFFAGLASVVVLTAIVEMLVVRRFAKAPRLVFTVATIGLSQTVVVISLLIPRLWGNRLLAGATVQFPWHFHFAVETQVFYSDSVVSAIVAAAALATVAIWLRLSDIGVATRATADRRDRAAMLGIPVNRLQTVTWVVAGVLSFLSIFLQATINGSSVDPTFSLEALVTALSALALGGFASLPLIAVSAVAIALLQAGVTYDHPADPTLPLAVTAAVVLLAMAVRHFSVRTTRDSGLALTLAGVARELPRSLSGLPLVRGTSALGAAALAAAVATLPLWLGTAHTFEVATLLALAVGALSIVVLTGWAGLVSLGQMSFAAAGAAAAAVAMVDWHFDFSLAVLCAAGAGALVAVAVGVAAIRFGGIFIAVTTLVFALAASGYLLDPAVFSWIPTGQLGATRLFGAVVLSSETSLFETAIGLLVVCLLAVHGLRQSRTGRVLKALRTNERAAAGYGVRVNRAKLSAFALSGAIAGVAGCLLLLVNGQYVEASYYFTPAWSIGVFTVTAVGGLGAATGAVLGAAIIEGSAVFLPPSWQSLPAGAGILLVLLAFPEGLAGPLFRSRDRAVGFIARRFGLVGDALAGDALAGDALAGDALAGDTLAGDADAPA